MKIVSNSGSANIAGATVAIDNGVSSTNFSNGRPRGSAKIRRLSASMSGTAMKSAISRREMYEWVIHHMTDMASRE